MLPPVFAILKAAPDVTAILGAVPKVYAHGKAPQGAVPPYVVWSSVGSEPQNELSEVPSSDKWILQLDCYSLDGAAVQTLARAVRDAMEPHAALVGVPVDDQETETKLYRIALQFDYWLTR